MDANVVSHSRESDVADIVRRVLTNPRRSNIIFGAGGYDWRLKARSQKS